MKVISNIETFIIVRDEDESGVSGTGIVAEGVCFTGGAVVVTWFSHFPAFNVYPGGMKTVEGLHGHNGKTRVVMTGVREFQDTVSAPKKGSNVALNSDIPSSNDGNTIGDKY